MRFYWPIAKVDAEQHMVWGYASTETEDEQGESVARDALRAALGDYMRFANIREMHQPSAVGVAKEAEIDDKGLYLGAKIVDGDAWRKVVEGVYKGFSIGGRVTARDPVNRRLITGLVLTEISVVDRPANPEAVFDCWKLSGARVGDARTPAGHHAPVQVWDCGVAAHRHLAKAEALRCIAAGPAEKRAQPGAAGSGDGDPGDLPEEAPDYADPGYQPDGKNRYPIDTESHIRAAWAYIHQAANASRYSPEQLQRIKARIVAAWKSRIDPAGPAAAVPEPDRARKGLAEIGRLARLALDLDWLSQRIAFAAALRGETSPLPAIIAELRDDIDAMLSAEGGELGFGDRPDDIAAMANVGGLKAPRPDPGGVAAGLAALADRIVPRLDALQKRVEAIAATPLPPQTAARAVSALSKRQDGDDRILPDDDVVAALARMSDEERTLTLIKAAHANPIRR